MVQFIIVIVVVFGMLAAVAAATRWIDRDADKNDVEPD